MTVEKGIHIFFDLYTDEEVQELILEYSEDGRQYIKAGKIEIPLSGRKYEYKNASLNSGLYRIKAISKVKTHYSNAMRIIVKPLLSQMKVSYINSVLSLDFGKPKTGSYLLIISDEAGRTLLSKNLNLHSCNRIKEDILSGSKILYAKVVDTKTGFESSGGTFSILY